MAISLSIQRNGQPPEEARTVPIATMAVFDHYWAPAAQALALQWIPLFRTGIPVERDDVDNILIELTALRKSIQTAGGDASEIVLPRIDQLITELQSLDSDSELYIG